MAVNLLCTTFVIFLVFILFVVSLVSGTCTTNTTPCRDWTLCSRVRCAAPANPCPKDHPYLLWDDCGCCQFCSKCQKEGPCGICGIDVVCKDRPVCKDNQIITLDNCGCCKVCKNVLEAGQKCETEGFYTAVCARGLRCINGICSE